MKVPKFRKAKVRPRATPIITVGTRLQFVGRIEIPWWIKFNLRVDPLLSKWRVLLNPNLYKTNSLLYKNLTLRVSTLVKNLALTLNSNSDYKYTLYGLGNV